MGTDDTTEHDAAESTLRLPVTDESAQEPAVADRDTQETVVLDTQDTEVLDTRDTAVLPERTEDLDAGTALPSPVPADETTTASAAPAQSSPPPAAAPAPAPAPAAPTPATATTPPAPSAPTSPVLAAPQPTPTRPRLRIATVVWGLIVAALGVGVLIYAAGYTLDAQLALIVLLTVAGVTLLVGSLLGNRRGARR
ncbi:hypothetical protein [Cellulomonas soli]